MKAIPYYITLSDLPPSPFDDERLSRYRQLFNTFILTEDDVKLIHNNKVNPEYLKAIENLSKHDLNIFIRNMYNDPDYFDSEEKDGSNYGNPYHMSPRHITNEFCNYPNVNGFYMADEPYMKEFAPHKEYTNFDSLRKTVDFKNKYYPETYFHMNMVPSASFDHYFFTDENGKYLHYSDFISYYINTIAKNVKSGGVSICLDNYPFIHKDYIEFDYLDDLLTVGNLVRDYNLKGGHLKARFGICIQTFKARGIIDVDSSRDITLKEEITLQLFTGLALGATLFEYFCYKPMNEEQPGILDQFGKERLFSLVADAQKDAKEIMNELIDYHYVGAFIVHSDNPYISYRTFTIDKEKFIKTPACIKSIKTTGTILIGYFENGEDASLMIVSFADPIHKYTANVTLNLAKCQKISTINAASKEELITDHIQKAIPSGQAVLIKFKL